MKIDWKTLGIAILISAVVTLSMAVVFFLIVSPSHPEIEILLMQILFQSVVSFLFLTLIVWIVVEILRKKKK